MISCFVLFLSIYYLYFSHGFYFIYESIVYSSRRFATAYTCDICPATRSSPGQRPPKTCILHCECVFIRIKLCCSHRFIGPTPTPTIFQAKNYDSQYSYIRQLLRVAMMRWCGRDDKRIFVMFTGSRRVQRSFASHDLNVNAWFYVPQLYHYFII